MMDQHERVTHALRSRDDLFEAIVQGRKHHELRRTDRPFAVGDVLILREHTTAVGVAKGDDYTGREAHLLVTYITSADFPCALSGNALNPDYCILSVELLRVVQSSDVD